jgi:proteasome lid subunit RPN8/RPN11
LERLAERRYPFETGGILLGIRRGRHVQVVDVIEVPDPTATHSSYVLHAEPRERVLALYLRDVPANSMIGYVGDWHSHPADVEASGVDRAQLRRDAQTATDTLAMIVMVKTARGWRSDGLLMSHSGQVKDVRTTVTQPSASSGKGQPSGGGKDGST